MRSISACHHHLIEYNLEFSVLDQGHQWEDPENQSTTEPGNEHCRLMNIFGQFYF
jgi:hypothetical protein